jgi:hypothetical protein
MPDPYQMRCTMPDCAWQGGIGETLAAPQVCHHLMCPQCYGLVIFVEEDEVPLE